MVKFILGEKGAGKTKWLIDNANIEMKKKVTVILHLLMWMMTIFLP